MCGIAAIFAYGADATQVDPDELVSIRDQMVTRGPDGFGTWLSPDRRIGLAHRRLSIIDLSENGAQPMCSSDGRFVITFNGEIYNYRMLRADLVKAGAVFRSSSDTEVLLHLYAAKGRNMVRDLRGMFAFAIWDNLERILFLARDPFGIKPLYYADDGRTIRIASQVKALLKSKCIDTAPEPAGHVGFFLWGSVPDPFTLYRGINALPAGHTLTIGSGPATASQNLREYCSIPSILRDAHAASEASSVQLHSVLSDSINAHLVADVPVGVFLSAGIDSTTIAAYVSAVHQNVRTVTLGFSEFRGKPEDEVPLAESVARQHSANHETVWITRDDFAEHAARLLQSMDQPSIDGVNTYFVSLAARRAGLTVALSGLGGDEIFGGYPSFREVPRAVGLLEPLQAVPSVGKAFRVVSCAVLRRFTSPKYAGLLEYGPTYGGAYLLRRGLFMPWELPDLLDPDLAREGWARLGTIAALNFTADSAAAPSRSHGSRCRVSALEICWYMRNQLLRDSDWAGMAHSLEIRVPLVDIELLRRIAPALAAAAPPTKIDFARSAPGPIPEQILNRPKTGFTVPVREWILDSAIDQCGHAISQPERGLRGWARLSYSSFGSN